MDLMKLISTHFWKDNRIEFAVQTAWNLARSNFWAETYFQIYSFWNSFRCFPSVDTAAMVGDGEITLVACEDYPAAKTSLICGDASNITDFRL